ncbi:hypothetical protein nACB1_059 [Acinetobacter phage nACB1]|nr:hypothetical protein nACB1_059 [Acinetobacter phage nACB1]
MALLKLGPLDPAPEALSRAKIKLMLKKDVAFFATLILQTPVFWVSADEIPTAATNGINLYMNPDFFLSLDPEERLFLILHEIMHNVYNHCTRRGFRDATTWNEACDYVINDELIQRNFKMPKDGLHDSTYRNMSADDVYDLLMERKNKGGSNAPSPWPDLKEPQASGAGNQSPQNGGAGNQTPSMGQPTAEEIEEHNKNLLTQATQASQMAGDKAGTVPGSLQRELDDLLYPKLPWDKILAKFLFTLSKDDYSWRKPNRRFISQGIIMPSLHSEGIGKIDFAIDTSGSVSKDDFNRFISEIGYVFKRFNPKEIGIMQFDSILQSNDKVVNAQDFMKLEFKGGGGTQIEPVLEAFKESEGKALIILTDGYLHHSAELDPKKPVVWCIYNNPRFVPTFGTAIHFDN